MVNTMHLKLKRIDRLRSKCGHFHHLCALSLGESSFVTLHYSRAADEKDDDQRHNEKIQEAQGITGVEDRRHHGVEHGRESIQR